MRGKLDLYGILGLHRDADRKQIDAAYRRMAKKAHPDSEGGSEERFALVCLARDILRDDARRAHYDATGDAEEMQVDQVLQNAMEYAFSTMQFVLAEAERKGMGDDFDLLGDSVKTLQNKLREIAEAERAYEKLAKSFDRMAKRFRAKKGKTERLSEMWRSHAAQTRRQAAGVGVDRSKIELAIEILKDHDYQWTYDPPAGAPTSGMAIPSWFTRTVA